MNKPFGSILPYVIAAAAALFIAGVAHAQGHWVKLAPFPEPGEELLGAAAGGKMYVFAGLAPGFKPMGLVYEYDPASDKWTKKKSMPFPVHHQAMAEYNGKLYMFGGYLYYPPAGRQGQGWQPVDNAWVYDPATDNWTALAPMPDKRGSAICEPGIRRWTSSVVTRG
jgi:N-acetylneuraminic acid mutarotase